MNGRNVRNQSNPWRYTSFDNFKGKKKEMGVEESKILYAEEEGMKAASKGNWPRVVFWAKRWLKMRGSWKGVK